MKHENYNVDHLDFNHYPETGVELVPMPAVANASYNYKYNGKELQEELGLNMTAMDYRQYDNALGRFNSIDALSELTHSLTPYRFAYNNPNIFSDPTGLYEIDGNGNIVITDADEIKKFTGFLKNNQKASVDDMADFVFNPGNEFSYQLETIFIKRGNSESENDFYNNLEGQIKTAFEKIENFSGTVYYDNKKYDDEGIPNSVHTGAIGLAATMADATLQARFYKTFEAMKTTNLNTSFTKSLKVAGKAFQAVGAVATIYTYYQSDKSGADKARIIGGAIITGTAFIPVFGPFISVGFGVLDGVGAFDAIYNKFD